MKKTKALTTRTIRTHKKAQAKKSLQMLTCYDYQTACMLDETNVDLLLIGDSLGNVILGLDNTIGVGLVEMTIFGSAVVRGAKNKFTVVDMPFGTYATVEDGLKNAIKLYKDTGASSVKIEGAFPHHLEMIQALTRNGVPVMGHIGLTPQSVGELGGYYTHGKDETSAKRLIEEAADLEHAGAFAVVLECVDEDVATQITKQIKIPTIGIGAGKNTDGQVLVINDLLKLGPARPPKFCTPVADLFETKKDLINDYLKSDESCEQTSLSLFH